MTEELIKKLDFKKDGDLYYLKIKDDAELWYLGGVLYLAGRYCPNINYAIKLETYTLQSFLLLYFSITGKIYVKALINEIT